LKSSGTGYWPKRAAEDVKVHSNTQKRVKQDFM
jgi:hypothetical protein